MADLIASNHQINSGFDGESRIFRHRWTPYDYCWQTIKLDFVAADLKYQKTVEHFLLLANAQQ